MNSEGIVRSKSGQWESETEERIADNLERGLDELSELSIEPGLGHRIQAGSGDGAFQYVPDIIVRDKLTGHQVVIEVRGRIATGLTATLSRLRAINRAIANRGDCFLLILSDPIEENRWLHRDLEELSIDHLIAVPVEEVTSKVVALVTQLRQG